MLQCALYLNNEKASAYVVLVVLFIINNLLFLLLIDAGIKSKTVHMVSRFALFFRHSALSTIQV